VTQAGTGSRLSPGAPLPARSVLLSVLLGSHPPRLPVRTLVRTAALFGISEGTARVALSRLTADGEVVADDAVYGLSDRHLARQHDQDSALRPATGPWQGTWEVAVVPGDGRPGGDHPAGAALARRSMAELRPGVWTRPDNLALPPPPLPGLVWWSGAVLGPGPDGVGLARRLWDLDGWAATAVELRAALAAASEPAERLAVAAAMVRHIRADPILPAALLPPGWPGDSLRGDYDRYRMELGRLIAGLRDS
jgi:phenylacetic acid degradation operon negative regulatory protein